MKKIFQQTANSIVYFLVFFVLIFINLLAASAQAPNGTINPGQGENFCPDITNTRNFTLSLTNVANNNVRVILDNKLTVTNLTVGANNELIVTLWFEDQNLVQPQLRFQRISDGALFETTFEFPHLLSLAQRNVFPVTASNKLDIATSICTQNINISFDKMKYLVPGSNSNNSNNYFKDVDFYQYVLPSGVSPVSGLTPVAGLPNNYTGTNNVTVQVSNPFNNATLQVKGISSDCNNVQSSILNSINIIRPQLSLSGVSSMRCGETDTKTFTIQNIPSSPNCITSYTWQIANKGWKYNGSIPTSDVVTSTPSIQLQSADNNAAPPQSFSVVVASSSANITLNKTINYLAPTISIPIYSGDFGLNCNVTNVNAVLTNAPISSYNLLWSTVNGYYIDGAASPQSSGTLTTVSLEKVGSSASDLLTVSLQASCGTINSVGGYNYEGCLPWDDLSVDYFNSVPMKPDPLLVYCSTQDQLAGLLEFEWYWFNGSYYTFAGNSPGLSFWSDTWPCGMNSLYVRAKWYSGTSELKYVGDYDGYCARLLTTPIKKDEIKIFPNPATNLIIVDYTPKNNVAVLRLLDLQGKLLMQNEIKNDANKARLFTKVNLSKLPRGRYLVAIQDGKNKYTRIIEKL